MQAIAMHRGDPNTTTGVRSSAEANTLTKTHSAQWFSGIGLNQPSSDIGVVAIVPKQADAAHKAGALRVASGHVT
jgi:hypothetical protein